MSGFNNEQWQQFSEELADSIAATMRNVAETVRAASITIEEGMKAMQDTFATYTEWVRENYPAAVDANGKLRDNFLQIIADADEGNRAERYYVESLNTQPRHECEGLGDNAGYVDLLPPHHGTDGPVKTVHGMFVVYASSSWKLAIDQEEVDVEFCPFCGKQLLASANEPGNNAGDVDNAEEALYDSPQSHRITIQFYDLENLGIVETWEGIESPARDDIVCLHDDPGDPGAMREYVVRGRSYLRTGGVYYVKCLVITREKFDRMLQYEARMTRRKKS